MQPTVGQRATVRGRVEFSSVSVDPRLTAEALFDLTGWPWPELFAADEPAWETLRRLARVVGDLVAGRGAPVVPAGVFIEGDVLLGEGVKIEPGAFIQGPTIIGDRAQIRQGAYLRGNVVIGPEATVGHCSEVKGSVLLRGAAAPHFNYVGDSLLGAEVNLGAGTILSNLKLARDNVRLRVGDGFYDTGLRKFGAILGDGCQTGCNSVLNPGTIAGRGCVFHPLTSAVGFFAAGSVVRGTVAREPR